jgi:hypothetical protein
MIWPFRGRHLLETRQQVSRLLYDSLGSPQVFAGIAGIDER